METPKCDSEDFIVPERDESGRGKCVRCRIPPQMGKVIFQIVSSNKFPFRNQEDLIRWCIYRGLRELGKMEPTPNLTSHVEMMIVELREDFLLEHFNQFFQLLGRAVLGLLSWGAEEQARRLVRAVEVLIICMPSGYWRSGYLTELRQRWGHLLFDKTACSAEAGPTKT